MKLRVGVRSSVFHRTEALIVLYAGIVLVFVSHIKIVLSLVLVVLRDDAVVQYKIKSTNETC